jgi:hypothetical protein
MNDASRFFWLHLQQEILARSIGIFEQKQLEQRTVGSGSGRYLSTDAFVDCDSLVSIKEIS